MSYRLFAVALFTSLLLLSGTTAFAINPIRVGADSVENYSGCGCNSGNLSYTNDQSTKFMNRIDDWHTRSFLYTDSVAWNWDFVEDQLSGGDQYAADSVHLMLISGHGAISGSTYYGYLCSSSSLASCSFNTGQTYLGEVAGQSYSTNPGSLRFLILATCYGVDQSNASAVWRPVFQRGRNFMYVMGYTGTSADSESTDEVPEDFAQKAAGEGWTLKQAWFWAIEDWLINDHAGVISAGDTEAEAISNRDNLRLTSDPNITSPVWMAWAYHEG